VAALGAARAGIDDYVSRLNESTAATRVDTATRRRQPAMGPTRPGPTCARDDGRWEAARALPLRRRNSAYTGRPRAGRSSPNGNIVVTSTGKVQAHPDPARVVSPLGLVDFVYFTDSRPRTRWTTPSPPPLPRSTGPRRGRVRRLLGVRSRRARTSSSPVTASRTGPQQRHDAHLREQRLKTSSHDGAPVAANSARSYRTSPCAGGTGGTTFARANDPSRSRRSTCRRRTSG
jgi:hypothetical protein